MRGTTLRGRAGRRHQTGGRQGAYCADRKQNAQRGPMEALFPPNKISFRSGRGYKTAPRKKGGQRNFIALGGKKGGPAGNGMKIYGWA